MQSTTSKFLTADAPVPVTAAQAAAGRVVRAFTAIAGEQYNVKDYGAIGDGTSHPVSEWVTEGRFDDLADIQTKYPHVVGLTDEIDWAAAQMAADDAGAALGGIVWFPSTTGTYRTNRKLHVSVRGVRVEGQVPGYSDGADFGTVIEATDTFADDAILEFSDGTDPIRSVGACDLELRGNNSVDTHGMIAKLPYDGASFDNIHCTFVGTDKNGFRFLGASSGVVDVGQTVTCKRLISIHRNDIANTAAGFCVDGMNEMTFENCKAFMRSSSGPGFKIVSSSGILLSLCSSAFTTGYGVEVIAGGRFCAGVTIESHTLEDVAKPINFNSNSYQLYGTISAPPAVGAQVWQPADGSTAKGTVALGVSGGIYTYVDEETDDFGDFTTGAIYNSSGVQIGTIDTLNRNPNRGVVFRAPRITGAAGTTPAESTIQATLDFNVEWYQVGQPVLDYPLTIAATEASGTVWTDGTHTIDANSNSSVHVESRADGATLRTGSSLPAANLTGTINDSRLSANVPLLNAANTFTAAQTINAADGAKIWMVAGVTKGIRFGASSTTSSVEGVDQTGFGSFQPLLIGGSEVSFEIGGVRVARFATTGNFTLDDAINVVAGTTTGSKIGTATTQKLGFWNATPVVQQVLATGGGATVDNVISLLQTLGLCKQS